MYIYNQDVRKVCSFLPPSFTNCEYLEFLRELLKVIVVF